LAEVFVIPDEEVNDQQWPKRTRLLALIPTGAWGEETRDFHIIIKLDDTAVGIVGDTKLCARVGVVYSENDQEVEIKLNEGGQALAVWTDDEKFSRINTRAR